MAVTEFLTEIENGPIESSAVTISMVADDASIAIFGPVVLSTGTIADMPRAASTTTGGDKNVFGVCVKIGDSEGTITADVTPIEVCIYGIVKIKVNDADVALNDALETNTTAGEARLQADPTVDPATLASLAADVVIVNNNIRKCFAIALSTVTSGADSIVAAFVNINCLQGDIT